MRSDWLWLPDYFDVVSAIMRGPLPPRLRAILLYLTSIDTDGQDVYPDWDEIRLWVDNDFDDKGEFLQAEIRGLDAFVEASGTADSGALAYRINYPLIFTESRKKMREFKRVIEGERLGKRYDHGFAPVDDEEASDGD